MRSVAGTQQKSSRSLPPASGQSRLDLIVVQVRDNAIDAGANNDFIVTNVTGVAATTRAQVAPAVLRMR